MKALDLIKNDVERNTLFHAYLFIGKNDEMANELINHIVLKTNCFNEDVLTVAPEEASGKKGEIKIDQIRNLLHDVNLSPAGSLKIAIIKNCEKLNNSSSNLLLKSLEEPPDNMIFLLFSSNNQILPTIKSRCRIAFLLKDLKHDVEDKDLVGVAAMKNFYEASREIEKIVKNDIINNYLTEIEKHLRNKMIREKIKGASSALQQVLDAKRQIAGNANPRLTLECLYFNLRSII